MAFKRCDEKHCHACDIAEILDDLAQDLSVEAAISLVLHAVGEVYGLDIMPGDIVEQEETGTVH